MELHELCTLVVVCVKYCGTLFCRLSVALHRSYWTRILETLKEGPARIRVQHGPVTLYIPLVLVSIGSVRSVLVLLYLDQLDLDQRILMLTEIFPRPVRRQIEVLLLSWSIFYLLNMALDSSRTTKQMAFLGILVIGEKDFRQERAGLGHREWLRFKRLRHILVTGLDWLMLAVIAICWVMLWMLVVVSGALVRRPVVMVSYTWAYFTWVAALSYPIYCVMTTIILLAGFYTIQQKSLQRQLARMTRRGNLQVD